MALVPGLGQIARGRQREGTAFLAATLLTLWLAGRLRIVSDIRTTPAESLAAAAQATVDADEALAVAK